MLHTSCWPAIVSWARGHSDKCCSVGTKASGSSQRTSVAHAVQCWRLTELMTLAVAGATPQNTQEQVERVLRVGVPPETQAHGIQCKEKTEWSHWRNENMKFVLSLSLSTCHFIITVVCFVLAFAGSDLTKLLWNERRILAFVMWSQLIWELNPAAVTSWEQQRGKGPEGRRSCCCPAFTLALMSRLTWVEDGRWHWHAVCLLLWRKHLRFRRRHSECFQQWLTACDFTQTHLEVLLGEMVSLLKGLCWWREI